MIAPPTVDGGTAFKLERAPADLWRVELRELVALVRGGKALPPTVTFTDADGVILTAHLLRGNSGAVTLTFADGAQLELYGWGGFAVLIAKASVVWSGALRDWMTTWFDRASWLLAGSQCPDPESAAALGWRTRNLELCADFTGLEFVEGDVGRFVGPRGGAKRIDSHGFKPHGSVETIELGKRRRDALSIGTHDKTQKLRRDKQQPAQSVYSPTWHRHGWDGVARVRRVEVRANGRALRLRGAHPPVTLDLTNPATLLDDRALGQFWRHATRRLRLVGPGRFGNATDLRHAPTDPRWVDVQEVGGPALPGILVVDRTEARRLEGAELRRRDGSALVKALARSVGRSPAPDLQAGIERVVAEAVVHPDFKNLVAAARERRYDVLGSTIQAPPAGQPGASALACTQGVPQWTEIFGVG
ncbi:MAG: hypothetical protein IPQ09_23735 [Myxococcales bacterium]|nr:hypothetical protein [Myxococcales bacterium]